MKQKLYVLAVAIVVSLLACPALRAASSGTCGAKVTWTLDDAGNLVIEGSGAMDVSSPLILVLGAIRSKQ